MGEWWSSVTADIASAVIVGSLGLLMTLILRARWTRRAREKAPEILQPLQLEAVANYGFTHDCWSPEGSLADLPPGRDGTLPWALERGGGPFLLDGRGILSVSLSASEPANFEVQRVLVNYERDDSESGVWFMNVRDGLGDAGAIDPACFEVKLGHQGRHRNSVTAERVTASTQVTPAAVTRVTKPYRLSNATQLDIDLELILLDEGIYTISISIALIVNGARRDLVVDHGRLESRDFPLRRAHFHQPSVIHEEYVDAPWSTRWVAGPPTAPTES